MSILSVYLKAQKFVTCVGNLLLITSLQSADRKIRANTALLEEEENYPKYCVIIHLAGTALPTLTLPTEG